MGDARLRRLIKQLTPGRVQHELDVSTTLESLSALTISYAKMKDLEPLIKALLSAHPGCQFFEFVLANDQVTRSMVLEGLSPHFTLPRDLFLHSLAFEVLQRLRNFYLTLPTNAAFRKLDEAHRSISESLAALDALGPLTLNPIKDTTHVSKGKGGDAPSKKLAKQPHRRKKSESVRAPKTPAVNPNTAGGVSSEADELAGRLVLKQKRILTLYVDMLGDVNVKRIVKTMYSGVGLGNSTHDELVSALAIESHVTPTEKQPAPSTYPGIQPMRAPEYFSDQDQGKWPVVLSTRTFKQLRQLDTGDVKIFEIVHKRITELSQGGFSGSNQKRLAGEANEVPIFEAKVSPDLHLVYQVDYGLFTSTLFRGSDPHYVGDFFFVISYGSGSPPHKKPMIRIYGIYEHAQIDTRLWKSIANYTGGRGDEYRRKIKTKAQNVAARAGDPELETVVTGAPDTIFKETDYLELHSILALEKLIPYSQTLLDKILHSDKDTYEFLVSEYEDEIIHHPSSSLVIGRSGTGKTTTMLFKMIAYERGAAADGVKVRQLFVSQSRVLAGRVKVYFHSLLEATGTPDMTHRLSTRDTATRKQPEGLLELDDDYERDTGLPARWSELEDHHFPLFFTFDHLFSLLEAELGISLRREDLTQEQHNANQRYALKDADDHDLDLDDVSLDPAQPVPASPQSPRTWMLPAEHRKKKHLLTYEQFLSNIWPRLDQRGLKGLDPVLVFGEFLGVIKGHELTLEIPDGYLDRETYEGLSTRAYATFAHIRPVIYSLFEAYLQQKLRLEYYDAPDRTHALLKSLAKITPGEQIDFLYVDEAQDNLIIDACLLRMLCRTPHGLCFCGDTAQTIALGSSFRFDDLKAFLWRLEESDPLVLGGKREAIHPKFFQLAVNYRSHGGIVDAATCVVGIIMKLFPDSIDVLDPEHGLVAGPRPVFFHGWGEDVRYEQFLFGEVDSRIEFGAEQVILVRNDAARDELRGQIGGEIGLILTLYESKGLEFSDVLLYNFFTDSPADERTWRVVLNCLDEESRGGISVPEHDETKHAAIQKELKFLYVGLTRARRQIWIWDSSVQANPMLRLWSSKHLINECGPDDPMPQLAVTSSEADWSKSGRLLFSKRLFIQAKYCFEKANLPSEASIAQAYQLRKEAKGLPLRHPGRLSIYVNVANHFSACGGEAIIASDRIRLHQIAAECYLEAGEHCKAANAFLGAEDYTSATLNFRKGKDLDSSVKVIQQHAKQVNPQVAAKIIKYAKVVYSRESRLEKAGKLFENADDYLEFLEDLALDSARLKLLERLGRFDEAGDMCRQQGDELRAIHFFLKSQSSASQAKALESLLDGLWRHFTFGSASPEDNRATDELLGLAKSLERGYEEIEMFHALRAESSTSNSQRLANMGLRFIGKGNQVCALVTLDRALRNPPSLQLAPLGELIAALASYQAYGQQIRSITTLGDIPGNAAVQKIFNFVGIPNPSDDDSATASHEFRIPPSSILFQNARPWATPADTSDGSIIVPRRHIDGLVRGGLFTRFETTLHRLHELALKAKALHPCTEFAMTGKCGRGYCAKDHVASSVEAFNMRVRACCQLIMVMDFMRSTSGRSDPREKLQRIWLNILFETLHPLSHATGTLTSLNPALIPEYNAALPLIKMWTNERFNRLEPHNTRNFINAVMNTSLLAFTFDYENSIHYTARAPCALQNHPEFIRPPTKTSAVQDCLIWLTGKEPTSISAGILFVRYTINASHISINVNGLVHFIERLATQMIMNERLSLKKGEVGFNTMTMPKSWMIQGLARYSPIEGIQRATLLVGSVVPLMEFLCHISSSSNEDRYQHEGFPFKNVPNLVRSVLLARLYRVVVLLGYNSRSAGLKNMILRTVMSLSRSDVPYSALYQGYISARDWGQLARTVRTSMMDSPLDEMIQLILGSERPVWPIPGIRVLFFLNKQDILRKIGFYSNPIPLASMLNPQVEPFIAPSVAGPLGMDDQVSLNGPVGEIDDGPESLDPSNETAEAELDDPENIEEGPRAIFAVERTEEEHAAARVIQRCLRMLWSRRSNVRSGGPFFDACLSEVAKEIEQGDSESARRYRKYYLGPLPHVLTYLNRTTERCVAAKKQLSQRMNKESNESLDSLIDKVDTATQLRKDLIAITKVLKPLSSLHKEYSLERLRDTVRKVQDLKGRADDLLKKGIAERDEDYELGMKGLVQEHKVRPVQVVERPTLNTDDLDYD